MVEERKQRSERLARIADALERKLKKGGGSMASQGGDPRKMNPREMALVQLSRGLDWARLASHGQKNTQDIAEAIEAGEQKLEQLKRIRPPDWIFRLESGELTNDQIREACFDLDNTPAGDGEAGHMSFRRQPEAAPQVNPPASDLSNQGDTRKVRLVRSREWIMKAKHGELDEEEIALALEASECVLAELQDLKGDEWVERYIAGVIPNDEALEAIAELKESDGGDTSVIDLGAGLTDAEEEGDGPQEATPEAMEAARRQDEQRALQDAKLAALLEADEQIRAKRAEATRLGHEIVRLEQERDSFSAEVKRLEQEREALGASIGASKAESEARNKQLRANAHDLIQKAQARAKGIVRDAERQKREAEELRRQVEEEALDPKTLAALPRYSPIVRVMTSEGKPIPVDLLSDNLFTTDGDPITGLDHIDEMYARNFLDADRNPHEKAVIPQPDGSEVVVYTLGSDFAQPHLPRNYKEALKKPSKPGLILPFLGRVAAAAAAMLLVIGGLFGAAMARPDLVQSLTGQHPATSINSPELEVQIAGLTRAMEDLESQVAALSSQAAPRTDQPRQEVDLTPVVASLDSVRSDLASLSSQLRERDSSEDSLQQQIAPLEQRLRRLDGSISALQAGLTSHSDSIAQLTERANRYHGTSIPLVSEDRVIRSWIVNAERRGSELHITVGGQRLTGSIRTTVVHYPADLPPREDGDKSRRDRK